MYIVFSDKGCGLISGVGFGLQKNEHKERKMSITRQEAIDKLLRSYETYFNITRFEEKDLPLTARCDFFEHSQKYVLSRKAELWSANSEEFLYLFQMPNLTVTLFEQCKNQAIEDGMRRMHVGPGHMYTFITAVFVCEACDKEALKALKKSHLYKSFKFSLHGWMDYHNAIVTCSTNEIKSNYAGKSTAKILKRVLFQK